MESNNRCTENVSLMELENIWFLLLPDIGAQWRPCLIALLSCLEWLRPARMLVTRSGHEPQQWLCSHNLQLDRLQSNVHYVFPRKLSLSLYHERFQQHLTWNMFLLVSWFWIFFSWSLILIEWFLSFLSFSLSVIYQTFELMFDCFDLPGLCYFTATSSCTTQKSRRLVFKSSSKFFFSISVHKRLFGFGWHIWHMRTYCAS